MGKLAAIWVKRFKRGPMDSKEQVRIVAGRGIEDNANQGGKRQVTILSLEAWKEAEASLGAEVDPRSRRANLLVSGIDLRESNGRVLLLGDVGVRIHGETRPCERMEDGHPGLKSVLSSAWRGGVYGEFLDDGVISVGDAVSWVDS